MNMMIATMFSVVYGADIAILDIESKDKRFEIVSRLRESLSSQTNLRLWGDEHIHSFRKLLGNTKSCSTAKCAAEIGTELSLDYVVYGQESNGIVDVSLMRIADKKVIHSDSITISKSVDRMKRFTDYMVDLFSNNDVEVYYANRYENNVHRDGLYRFQTDQEDVSIFVDDVISCTSPCSIPLTEGMHYAVFSKEGYTKQLWYFHTSKLFHVSLERNTQELQLTNIPAESSVYIDNQLQPQTYGSFDVDPGMHTIRIENRCYTSYTKDIMVDESNSKEFSVSMEPKMKTIHIPSQEHHPVTVKGKVYGYTGAPFSIPYCAEYVQYDRVSARVSDFEQSN